MDKNKIRARFNHYRKQIAELKSVLENCREEVREGIMTNQEHEYDTLDPLIVVLRNRFDPSQKKTYKADCPLNAYITFRPMRKDWVVESMTYLNNPDRPIEY